MLNTREGGCCGRAGGLGGRRRRTDQGGCRNLGQAATEASGRSCRKGRQGASAEGGGGGCGRGNWRQC